MSWIEGDCVAAVAVAVFWPTNVTEEEAEVVEEAEAEVVCAGAMVPELLGSAKTPATLVMTTATKTRAMIAVTIPTLPVARLSPSLERHRPFVNRPTECDPVRK
jgi:hypothetical protein